VSGGREGGREGGRGGRREEGDPEAARRPLKIRGAGTGGVEEEIG